jgi:ADP-ribosyl-[dinitrogen reductase] hydrolase
MSFGDERRPWDRVALTDRLAGGVWGHLVGDALGVPYEFKSARDIGKVVWGQRGSHQQLPGTWSDDGGLTLALLDSLLSVGFDPTDQGQRFLRWSVGKEYCPGPPFDIGATTSLALRRLDSGVSAEDAGGRSVDDNGNGSLMRILPIALVSRRASTAELITMAMRSSAITHGHARAKVACAVYCLVARRLLVGQPPTSALEGALDEARASLPANLHHEFEILETYPVRSGTGYVLDCFWSAYQSLVSSDSYQETVTRAVEYGNDTDTTAAVAGGLAGIHWGIGGIPAEWLRNMRGYEIVEPLVQRLLTE